MPGPSPAAGKAVAYVRASTEEQHITLAAQTEKIGAYCVMRGLELVEVVRDAGVSGAVPLGERPAGRRISALVRRPGVGHVVGLKLDRLFRDAADALAQTRAWDRAGVALHLCDMGGGAVDTSSPMGRMMLTMLAGFAEFERALIAERTRAALAHKRSLGQYTGGQAPRGFRRGEAGELVEDPGEAAAVAEARRLREAGRSLRGIAADLEAGGMVARSGRRLGPSQIRRMLA